MAEPKYSVSQVTTFHQTYDEDIAAYRKAGVEGMGVWEFKLAENDDADSVAKLKDAGMTATTWWSFGRGTPSGARTTPW